MTIETALPPAVRDDGIEYKCPSCHQSINSNIDLMGEEAVCPHCAAKTKVPSHVLSFNPFRRPILRLFDNITSMHWRFPYLAQVTETAVLTLVILINAGLYITVGIASQISGIFQSLIQDTRRDIKTGSLVEKSASAVTAGIYLILWLPFWLVLLPFSFLGWLWKHFGYAGLIVLAVGLGALVCAFHEQWVPKGPELLDWLKSEFWGGMSGHIGSPSQALCSIAICTAVTQSDRSQPDEAGCQRHMIRHARQ